MPLPVTVGGKISAADVNNLGNFPVANFAALPASGNWLGRRIATLDTGIDYRWNGSSWRPSSPYTTRIRAQSLVASNVSYTALSLPTAGVGSDFTHSGGVFTCAVAGTYRVTLTFSYLTNGTGLRGTRLVGSGVLGTRAAPTATANTGTDTTVTVEHHFTGAVLDTVTAQGFQNSGGNLSVEGAIVFERLE